MISFVRFQAYIKRAKILIIINLYKQRLFDNLLLSLQPNLKMHT